MSRLYKLLRNLTLVLAGVLMCSCLEEDKGKVVSPDNFFYTVEQCQASVNSAYIPLKSI